MPTKKQRPFEHMLAAKITKPENIQWPMLISPKYDGIRAAVLEKVVMSRKLKPIPSEGVQELLGRIKYNGLDGELICGDPCDPAVFQKTSSAVMSADKDVSDVKFYVFDKIGDQPFAYRRDSACLITGPKIVHVPQIRIEGLEELAYYTKKWIREGYEGSMLRSLLGPYKFGRATENEGYLLKQKEFNDAEAVILSVYEQMKNTNVATVSELGRTKRSSHKAGKVGKGTFGGVVVRGINGRFKGKVFNVGTGKGVTAIERDRLWAMRDTLPGQYVRYTFQNAGSKDLPRIPQWGGIRHEFDI